MEPPAIAHTTSTHNSLLSQKFILENPQDKRSLFTVCTADYRIKTIRTKKGGLDRKIKTCICANLCTPT